MPRGLLASFLAGLVLLLIVEAVQRARGVIDVPSFEVDARVGYWPRASQSGRFLNRFDWAYNERSLATSQPWAPQRERDVLLVGDSLVNGSRLHPASSRLGPRLAEASGRGVWPLAADSWALQNAMALLDREPDLVEGVAQVVWIVNDGDLDAPSSWRCDARHPRQPPGSALVHWAALRLGADRWCPVRDPSLTVPTIDATAAFVRQWTRPSRPLTVVLYPTRASVATRAASPVLQRFGERMPASVRVLDLLTQPDWTTDLYEDEIHPTTEGNAWLARWIATRIGEP